MQSAANMAIAMAKRKPEPGAEAFQHGTSLWAAAAYRKLVRKIPCGVVTEPPRERHRPRGWGRFPTKSLMRANMQLFL